jgi:hypothetical protein
LKEGLAANKDTDDPLSHRQELQEVRPYSRHGRTNAREYRTNQWEVRFNQKAHQPACDKKQGRRQANFRSYFSSFCAVAEFAVATAGPTINWSPKQNRDSTYHRQHTNNNDDDNTNKHNKVTTHQFSFTQMFFLTRQQQHQQQHQQPTGDGGKNKQNHVFCLKSRQTQPNVTLYAKKKTQTHNLPSKSLEGEAKPYFLIEWIKNGTKINICSIG